MGGIIGGGVGAMVGATAGRQKVSTESVAHQIVNAHVFVDFRDEGVERSRRNGVYLSRLDVNPRRDIHRDR